MNDQFGTKSRSKMRAYVRRLETCFDIHYKIFYGKITKEEFQFLFDRFLLMIKKRFSQRGDTHESLKKWDIIKQTAYPMILDRKASLFVIYDNEKPIDICLNYHHQNIMYNTIRSYDTDYSKFRLGYIDILKQLDWCFKNNYKVFDLGRGDLDYKRRWCNVVYDFEHHIIYQKNYLDKRILAFTSTKFYVLKELLKKKEIHILFHKIKSIFKKKPQNKTKYAEPTFKINDITKIQLNEKIVKIDIDSEVYSFLRKPIYDFQYINFESSNDVTLFKIKDVLGSYLIVGKNKKLKLTYNI